MARENIKFSIIGGKVEEIRLHELSKILTAYQGILDGTYLAYGDSKRMSMGERDNFYATLKSWNKGSIDIDFIVYASALAQTFISYGHSGVEFYTISKLKEVAYNFLKEKAIYFMREGKEPKIRIENQNTSGGDIYNFNHIQGNFTISPPVAKASDNMERPIRDLSSIVKKGRVGKFSSFSDDSSGQKNGFILTPEDAEIFNPNVIIDNDMETIVAKIYSFNSDNGRGKLRIIESGEISPDTRLSFDVKNKEISYDKLVDLLHSSVRESKIIITKDFILHPSGMKTCAHVHIHNILP